MLCCHVKRKEKPCGFGNSTVFAIRESQTSLSNCVCCELRVSGSGVIRRSELLALLKDELLCVVLKKKKKKKKKRVFSRSFVRASHGTHTRLCGKEENGVDMTLILWWKTNQRMTKAATDRVD